MNRTNLVLIATVYFLFACRNKEQLQAKIFERREFNDSSLIILYQYKLGDRTYTDSATIKNVVIRHDSIALVEHPKHHGKWIPLINEN